MILLLIAAIGIDWCQECCDKDPNGTMCMSCMQGDHSATDALSSNKMMGSNWIDVGFFYGTLTFSNDPIIYKFKKPTETGIKEIDNLISLTPDFASFDDGLGLKVGIGIDTCYDDFVLMINALWYGSDSKGDDYIPRCYPDVSDDSTPTPVKDMQDQGFIFPDTAYSRLELVDVLFNYYTYDYSFNHIDTKASFKRSMWIGGSTSLEPHLGMHFAWNEFKRKVTAIADIDSREIDVQMDPYTSVMDKTSDGATPEEVPDLPGAIAKPPKECQNRYYERSSIGSFWGCGIQFGVDSAWYVCGPLSIYLNQSLAVLVGENKYDEVSEYRGNALSLYKMSGQDADMDQKAQLNASNLTLYDNQPGIGIVAPLVEINMGLKLGGRGGFLMASFDVKHYWNQYIGRGGNQSNTPEGAIRIDGTGDLPTNILSSTLDGWGSVDLYSVDYGGVSLFGLLVSMGYTL